MVVRCQTVSLSMRGDVSLSLLWVAGIFLNFRRSFVLPPPFVCLPEKYFTSPLQQAEAAQRKVELVAHRPCCEGCDSCDAGTADSTDLGGQVCPENVAVLVTIESPFLVTASDKMLRASIPLPV